MLTNSSGDALKIGLVAHDAKKGLMVEWAKTHKAILEQCLLFTTGTTGAQLLQAMPDLNLTRLKSGPLGGDQQLGAMICEERLDALFFFVDPLAPMPHDVDIKALTRLALVYDLPLANSPSTADFVLTGLCAKMKKGA